MAIVDTDVMVDVLRGYPPAVAWLRSLGNEVLVIPGLVIMELLEGRRNRSETESLLRWIAKYEICWPTERDCNRGLAHFAFGRLGAKLSIYGELWAAKCEKGTSKTLTSLSGRFRASCWCPEVFAATLPPGCGGQGEGHQREPGVAAGSAVEEVVCKSRPPGI